MSSYNYKFKDVLVGLRDEYLVTKKQLDELQKYVMLDEKQLGEVVFVLGETYGIDGAQLLCEISSDRNKLVEFLNDVKWLLGMQRYASNIDYVVRDSKGNFRLMKYPCIIYPKLRREFSEKVSDILYDNFTFENGKVLRYDLEDGRNITLSLEHMGMNLVLKQNDLTKASMRYTTKGSESVSVISWGKPVNSGMVNELLDVEVPRTLLPVIHDTIIEFSDSKPVILQNADSSFNITTFDVIDEEQQLILRR